MNRGATFWWDDLEALLLHARPLPEYVSLRIGGEEWHVNLGEGRSLIERTGAQFPEWEFSTDAPISRRKAFKNLYAKFRDLAPELRDDAIEQLWTSIGAQRDASRNGHAMTREELVRLADAKLVEVGAHTVNHVALGSLPPAIQQREVRECKRDLEELLGRSVESFSYPYGIYGAETVAIASQAGFLGACSTRGSTVRGTDHILELPRVGAENCDGDVFAAHLKRCFDA